MSESDFPLVSQPSKRCKRSAKKVSGPWSDEDTYQLIENVASHPCIWNKQSTEYQNKTYRDAAWTEIFDWFGANFAFDDLKAKWSNLRIQFNSYSMKAAKSDSTGDDQVHWRFYKKMLFLKAADSDVWETVNPVTNFAVKEETSSLDSPENSRCSTPPPPSKKQKLIPGPSSADSTSQFHAAIENIDQEPKHEEFRLFRNALNPAIDREPTQEKLRMSGYAMNRAIHQELTPDEFQVFGNFIATELRKIPDINSARRVQRKMQRILLDYLDEIDQDSANLS